jgi:hypothetical protein
MGERLIMPQAGKVCPVSLLRLRLLVGYIPFLLVATKAVLS